MKIIQWIIRLYHNRLLRFLAVGTISLAVDASVLYSLRHMIGLIPAKIVSYIVAFSVAWLLNRCFTFQSQDQQRIREWGRYALIYIATGIIHVSIFAGLVYEYAVMHQHPIIALIITAVIIAFINFALSKAYAFKHLASES